MIERVLTAAFATIVLSISALAQTPAPSVRILLPERTRLLQGQLVDLVIQVRNAAAVSGLKVTAGDQDLTSKFSAPAKATLDCDTSSDWVVRANLQSFNTPGTITVNVSISADSKPVTPKGGPASEIRSSPASFLDENMLGIWLSSVVSFRPDLGHASGIELPGQISRVMPIGGSLGCPE